jgi:large subunit ribosomal protein L19
MSAFRTTLRRLAPLRKNFKESLLPASWHKLIDKYPDFLPEPMNRMPSLLVTKQVDDMIRRRTVIEIPEFYVGSILAVTCSDVFSETKQTKFVGLCIQRTGQLLRSNFTLRNVIDGMGVEIRYDLYNPLLLSIEVLKLEKRLDDELIYLRDAPPEYSTVPVDMKPVPLEEGADVPVNKIRVKMNPPPWSRRWERRMLKGIEKLEDVPELFVKRAKLLEDDNVNNFDTMLEYRRHCTEEQMYSICKRLAEHEKEVVDVRKETRARRFLRVTKKPPISQAERRDE